MPQEGPFQAMAMRYYANGYEVIPVDGKTCQISGVTGREGRALTREQVLTTVASSGHLNIAWRLPICVIGIDVDHTPDEGKHGADTIEAAEADLGPLPNTGYSTARGADSKRRIMFFTLPPGVTIDARAQHNIERVYGKHVDIIRRDHRYAVVGPSVNPETGTQYRWYTWDGRDNGDALMSPVGWPRLPEKWIAFLAADDPAMPPDGNSQRAEKMVSESTIYTPSPTAPEPGRTVGTVPPSLVDYRSAFQVSAPREFTHDEALRFCRPAMDDLARAVDGTINNTLNVAALTLAHFIDDFWSPDEAQGWLLEALRTTEYDGRTWRAESTIASAFRSPAWRAVLRADLPEPRPFSVATGAEESGAGRWRGGQTPDPGGTARGPRSASDQMESVAERMERLAAALDARLLDSEGLDSIPPGRPLIKGLLELNTLSRINGASNTGKSFVALDIAGCVGTGTPWRGMEVARGQVIYVVAEGATGIRKRVRAWEKRTGTKMTGVLFLPQPIQISDSEWEVFIEVCARREASLIVVDTQARATVGVEENSAREMGVMVARLDAMRLATGANVMLIHHSGRGSKSVVGAMDTELSVEKVDQRISLKVSKQKDGAYSDDPIKWFELETIDISPEGTIFDDPSMRSAYLVECEAPDSENESRESAGPDRALLTIAKELVLDVLTDGEKSFRQLEMGVREHPRGPLNSRGNPAISRSQIRSAIRSLADSGEILEDRAGANGARSTYTLPGDGPAESATARPPDVGNVSPWDL